MPKLYVCNTCGFVFPEELSELIESKYQVYCERCGSPFSLKGVDFKPVTRDVIDDLSKSTQFTLRDEAEKPKISSRDQKISNLAKTIQKLSKFAYIPVLIVSIISLAFLFKILSPQSNFFKILLEQGFLSIAGFLIVHYTIKHINPKIEEGKYQEILLDAFCFGILGCILFGSGFFILLMGILIFFEFIYESRKKKQRNFYMIGVYLKDSFNRFSTIGGVTIIFLGLFHFIPKLSNGNNVVTNVIFLNFFVGGNLVYFILLIISIITLIIDNSFRGNLDKKYKIGPIEAVRTFVLGVIGCVFSAAGIFILFKGIIMLFLAAIGPPDKIELDEYAKREREESYIRKEEIPGIPKAIEKIEVQPIEKKEIKSSRSDISSSPKIVEPKKYEEVKEEIHRIEKEEHAAEEEQLIKLKEGKREKEKKVQLEEKIELKLHESLLPVKNEKDKKLVKEYFTRIFNVLSKDIRDQIKELKIPKKEKNEILKELAYLSKEEQIKYINSIVSLYQEQIPKKLVERIQRLGNLKPEHMENILEQLKYMDSDEQVKFIQYLEKKA